MSEAEKRKRLNYKKRRKKWIIIQSVLVSLLLIAAVLSSVTYYRLDKTYYIGYSEKGNVNYKAQYKESEEYGEWVGSGQSYISALTQAFFITFDYELGMDTENVDYKYSYSVDATLRVVDTLNKLPIYEPVYELVPEKNFEQNSNNNLKITELVRVDFEKFNQQAIDFENKHSLSEIASSSLLVTMNINVKGNSDEFENDQQNNYKFTVTIPLTEKTFTVSTAESIPTGDSKVLACKPDLNQNIFKNSSIALAAAAGLLLLILVAFVYLTRNDDINYAIRVKRLVSSYKSYIQKINNRFDETGYQLLMVNTFNEMLGIRDTIQSPILMNENEDKTLTKFFIPTNTKILYVFEIKVDNYDELYASSDETTPTEPSDAPECVEAMLPVDIDTIEETPEVIEEPVAEAEPEVIEEPVAEAEPEVIEEPVTEAEPEVIEEPVAENNVAKESETFVTTDGQHSLFENHSPIAISEDDAAVRLVNGVVVHVRYRTSFTSRLIQSEPPIQDYYTAVKNHILSYKGIKARTSWNFESFNKGRLQCVKLNVKGNAFQVYLALDPKEYNANKYYFTDVSDKPKLSDVPMMLKIKSERALRFAFELIDEVMSKNGIKKSKTAPSVDYHMPYEPTEDLVDKGFVKVIFPEGITVDENTVVEKLNVTELLSIMKQNSDSQITIDEVMEQIMSEPDVELSDIDYVDVVDEVYEETEDKPGVDVIGVVWPERAHRNKIYRYDPNGHHVEDGDEVLVPTRDVSKNREVIRKAAVAHGNHKVDPDSLHHPLKKIIGVVKRRLEKALSDDK